MKKQIVNPFLPLTEYIPDGEPKVFNERLYLFGSHDWFDGKSYCMGDYQGWSTPIDDLGDWKNAGTIYRKNQDPQNTNGERNMFAPDVVQGLDKRYYLYYTLDLAGPAGTLSVAVADTPSGPYEYYGQVQFSDGHAWGAREGELLNYDPSVLVDEDGRVYLYTGIAVPDLSGLQKKVSSLHRLADGCYVVELAADMLTIKGKPEKLLGNRKEAKGTSFEGHAFFEAASIRKIGQRYYLVYCSENSHELCYATSDSPVQGFTYGGVIVSNADIGAQGPADMEAKMYYGNIHGGIVSIHDQWYVFYHRHTNQNQFSRQACAEKLTIDSDGAIAQVELTSSGLQTEPLATQGDYPAVIACNLTGSHGASAYTMIKPENNPDPYFTQETVAQSTTTFIANLREGSQARYKYFAFAGAVELALMYRGVGEGVMLVSLDGGQTTSAQLPLTTSSSWQKSPLVLVSAQGNKALTLTYQGTGSFDLAAIEFISSDSVKK